MTAAILITWTAGSFPFLAFVGRAMANADRMGRR